MAHDQSRVEDAVARLGRDLQATEQALSEARAELAHCRPVADAAHAYCAAYLDTPLGSEASVGEAFRLMLEAHQATTPSAVLSSHVIVERAELERLRADIEDKGLELAMLITKTQDVTERWRETDQETRQLMEGACYLGFVEALDELFEQVRDEALYVTVERAELAGLQAIAAAARHLAAVDGQGPFVETGAAWLDLRTALSDGA